MLSGYCNCLFILLKSRPDLFDGTMSGNRRRHFVVHLIQWTSEIVLHFLVFGSTCPLSWYRFRLFLAVIQAVALFCLCAHCMIDEEESIHPWAEFGTHRESLAKTAMMAAAVAAAGPRARWAIAQAVGIEWFVVRLRDVRAPQHVVDGDQEGRKQRRWAWLRGEAGDEDHQYVQGWDEPFFSLLHAPSWTTSSLSSWHSSCVGNRGDGDNAAAPDDGDSDAAASDDSHQAVWDVTGDMEPEPVMAYTPASYVRI